MRKKSLDQCLSYEILDASQKMGIARKKGMGGSLASVKFLSQERMVNFKFMASMEFKILLI
jgi:hypothetical protein